MLSVILVTSIILHTVYMSYMPDDLKSLTKTHQVPLIVEEIRIARNIVNFKYSLFKGKTFAD